VPRIQIQENLRWEIVFEKLFNSESDHRMKRIILNGAQNPANLNIVSIRY